ncbi:hypothetical protein Anapl_05376 [Anas platyrhynchos]|uniref:Uncharacterized protein n=1 Tax=Anas platyrhynchos TaxID=8839 RepID=R0JX96_ANAPL|nr:hypothetical protein Anapl_05376 [Anas platyrhynchos]
MGKMLAGLRAYFGTLPMLGKHVNIFLLHALLLLASPPGLFSPRVILQQLFSSSLKPGSSVIQTFTVKMVAPSQASECDFGRWMKYTRLTSAAHKYDVQEHSALWDPPEGLPALAVPTTLPLALSLLRAMIWQKNGHVQQLPASVALVHSGIPLTDPSYGEIKQLPAPRSLEPARNSATECLQFVYKAKPLPEHPTPFHGQGATSAPRIADTIPGSPQPAFTLHPAVCMARATQSNWGQNAPKREKPRTSLEVKRRRRGDNRGTPATLVPPEVLTPARRNEFSCLPAPAEHHSSASQNTCPQFSKPAASDAFSLFCCLEVLVTLDLDNGAGQVLLYSGPRMDSDMGQLSEARGHPLSGTKPDGVTDSMVNAMKGVSRASPSLFHYASVSHTAQIHTEILRTAGSQFSHHEMPNPPEHVKQTLCSLHAALVETQNGSNTLFFICCLLSETTFQDKQVERKCSKATMPRCDLRYRNVTLGGGRDEIFTTLFFHPCNWANTPGQVTAHLVKCAEGRGHDARGISLTMQGGNAPSPTPCASQLSCFSSRPRALLGLGERVASSKITTQGPDPAFFSHPNIPAKTMGVLGVREMPK